MEHWGYWKQNLFCMYRRSSVFCLVVPDRTFKTLKEEITNHILPGTTIVSDCWKGYDCLDSCNEFKHLTVDHSKNFINPKHGANTQTIERMWRELKK